MTKRTIKTYPLEFKQSSAKLAVESGSPVSETAKSLGISVTTLYGWVDKFHPKPQEDIAKKDPIHEENKRLLLENARLKQERDILKKAAAYFASEM
jgi:transposase-like protein